MIDQLHIQLPWWKPGRVLQGLFSISGSAVHLSIVTVTSVNNQARGSHRLINTARCGGSWQDWGSAVANIRDVPLCLLQQQVYKPDQLISDQYRFQQI